MSAIPSKDDTKCSDSRRDLILILSLDEEIIQFNEESERVLGYARNEVLHKKFIEILVPTESAKQWKSLLDSIRHTMWNENFVLPLKNKYNQIYTITWAGILVKDETSTVKNICIFGKPLQTKVETKQSLEVFSPVVAGSDEGVGLPEFEKVSEEVLEDSLEEGSSEEETASVVAGSDEGVGLPDLGMVVSKDVSEETPRKTDREMIMKHRVKKLLFASKKRDEESTIDSVQEQVITPLVSMAKLLETTSQKLDFMNDLLKELSQKYEMVTNRVAEFEKKEQRWEKKNKSKQKSLPSVEEPAIEEATQQPLKEEKEPQIDNTASVEEQPQNEKISFFPDPFGIKRQRQELNIKKQELELRLKEFESSEAQFQKEQHIFNARLKEFSKWQEKLKVLESEIEKRRQEMMRQEEMILSQPTEATPFYKKPLPDDEIEKDTEAVVVYKSDEAVNNIPQCAAIIQRGILKQINNAFVKLLGYTQEEIKDKSFFDFIALEGLPDIEKYYLDRLKGDAVSKYNTVLSVKDNNKIPVEITIKQAIYNREKAEIVIVSRLDA